MEKFEIQKKLNFLKKRSSIFGLNSRKIDQNWGQKIEKFSKIGKMQKIEFTAGKNDFSLFKKVHFGDKSDGSAEGFWPPKWTFLKRLKLDLHYLFARVADWLEQNSSKWNDSGIFAKTPKNLKLE